MTQTEYGIKWNTINDRIECQTAEMFAIARRLTNATYAHPNDQLNDGMKLGRCAEAVKQAQGQMILLNRTAKNQGYKSI